MENGLIRIETVAGKEVYVFDKTPTASEAHSMTPKGSYFKRDGGRSLFCSIGREIDEITKPFANRPFSAVTCSCGDIFFTMNDNEKHCTKCGDIKKTELIDGMKKQIEDLIYDWCKAVQVSPNFALQKGVGLRHCQSTVESYVGDSEAQQVKDWAKGSCTDNLLIQSDKAGNGKTHLAVASMRLFASNFAESRREKPTVYFASFSELMADIRSTFGKDSRVSDKDIIDFLCGLDCLVIDDIGAEKVTDFAQQTLYIVLNRRYDDMKPTIMTTNMNSQEVTASYGGRMLSRMVSGKIVSVKGIDNRVAKVHSVSMGGITPKSRKSIIEVISDFRNKPQSMPTIESYMESEEVLNLKKQISIWK